MGGRRASKIKRAQKDPNRRTARNKYDSDSLAAQERIRQERETAETRNLEELEIKPYHLPITTEEFYYTIGYDTYQRKDAVTNNPAFSLEEVTALIPQVNAAKERYLSIYGETPNPRALLVRLTEQTPFYVKISKNTHGGVSVDLFVRRSYRTRYLARPTSLESLSSTGIAVLD